MPTVLCTWTRAEQGPEGFRGQVEDHGGLRFSYVPGFDCHGLPIEIKWTSSLAAKSWRCRRPLCLTPAGLRAKYVTCKPRSLSGLASLDDGAIRTRQCPGNTRRGRSKRSTLLRKGFCLSRMKPVYWCIHDRTALADAEIEYEQHTSPSVYVRYRLTSDLVHLGENRGSAQGREVYTIIWTTTPWTLPASLAVAFHPILSMSPCRTGRRRTRLCTSSPPDLAAAVATGLQTARAVRIDQISRQPAGSCDLPAPIPGTLGAGINADYVTADQGTGLSIPLRHMARTISIPASATASTLQPG